MDISFSFALKRRVAKLTDSFGGSGSFLIDNVMGEVKNGLVVPFLLPAASIDGMNKSISSSSSGDSLARFIFFAECTLPSRVEKL